MKKANKKMDGAMEEVMEIVESKIREKIIAVTDLEKKYRELKNMIIIAIEIEENEEKKETLIQAKQQLNISRVLYLTSIL
jgi:hypothetical protein